jgi:hypothetical protein
MFDSPLDRRVAAKEGIVMKRLGVFGAAVATLALLISVTPATSDEKAKKHRHVVLRLAEVAADDEEFISEIDVDDNGFPTVGDYLVFSGEPVYERDRTTQVGVIRGDCLFVEVVDETAATIECDITFDLERGLITVEGPITFAEEDFEVVQEVAVTGGTDAYKTAHGELHVDLSEEEGFLFTFRLILH